MKVVIVALSLTLLAIYLSAIVPSVAEGTPSPNVSSETDTSPAQIELRAERSHVTADDVDNIKLTAFVYDTHGNPVADGYRINFTIGSAAGNNFTSNGNYDYVPGAMGRLGSPGNPFNYYQVATVNNSGSASVQFGWIDEFYSGNNSTIWAYSDDNASVFASTKVYSAAPMDSLTGYVVDSSGAGIGGIPITMHVMGMNGTTPYEIYYLTRTTSSSPPFVGKFAFDYIVLTGAAYGYVDAEVRFADNRTVYGRSGNFSMDRSATAIGNITLDIRPPNVTTQSPSATPRPTPGFEALLALIASFGAAYLMASRGGH